MKGIEKGLIMGQTLTIEGLQQESHILVLGLGLKSAPLAAGTKGGK